jgi:NAD(P)-dependent dehydrogenase (short-subunit alcohol dehydrogenase family)
VLLSGGSRGLGLAIVTDLLAAGLKVAAFARTVTPELTALGEKYPDPVRVVDDRRGQPEHLALDLGQRVQAGGFLLQLGHGCMTT